jgi:glutathione synthase/RimK-type ligase-like ATP-grasp enzyme
MKRLIILIDESSKFLISTSDFKNYTSMDIEKIKVNFLAHDCSVEVCKFSDLDLSKDYKGVNIIYQTSEAPGNFYKRYIEDVVYFLEKQGAHVIPKYEMLKAHHNKVYMELLKSTFADPSLKTIKSICYGSWVDARNYNGGFPVVIKRPSSTSSTGVFLAKDKKEYNRLVKHAGHILFAQGLNEYLVGALKRTAKKVIKYFSPSKSKFMQYDTTPGSTPIVIQTFIDGLKGDYKVLVFGKKYFTLYRKTRENDFRASGSGLHFVVPEEEHEGLLNFAQKLTLELSSPTFGMDIGFDGTNYHLFEFQMLHLGPSTLQKSLAWHEYLNGKWVRFEGKSDLEEEYSNAVSEYIDKSVQKV